MNHKISLSLLLLPALVACADLTTPEPLPVEAPILSPDPQVQRAYKADLFSRPIAVGMMHGWGEHPLWWLTRTPDSLDVVILKGVTGDLTAAQLYDLTQVRNVKQTRVLLGADLRTVELEGVKALDRQLSLERRLLKEQWAASDTEVTDEERAEALAAMTERVTGEYRTKYLRSARAVTDLLLEQLGKAPYDGYSVQLPETYDLLPAEEIAKLLESVRSAAAAIDEDYLFAVESPSEAARPVIEKAAWVIYDCPAVDPALELFAREAEKWPSARFIPAVDLSDPKNAIGYPDSKIFSPDKISRTMELVSWTAPNKAGVAYDHIEADVAHDSYALLRDLINAIALTK